MDSSVQNLALAQGIKDLLEKAGFESVESILKEALLDISNKLGIERYVAQIIKEAAKNAREDSRKGIK
jgi:histone H3/H4